MEEVCDDNPGEQFPHFNSYFNFQAICKIYAFFLQTILSEYIFRYYGYNNVSSLKRSLYPFYLGIFLPLIDLKNICFIFIRLDSCASCRVQFHFCQRTQFSFHVYFYFLIQTSQTVYFALFSCYIFLFIDLVIYIFQYKADVNPTVRILSFIADTWCSRERWPGPGS